MKKLYLGLLIFIVISISTTAILISQKTKENAFRNESGDKISNSVNNEPSNTEPQIEKEKTLNLDELYDQNDLMIEEVNKKTDILEKEITIPVIKGLKNKKVENKINQEIETRIIEPLQEEVTSNNLNDVDIWLVEYSNFSNVISLNCSIGYSIKDKNGDSKYNNKSVCLNYELINGNQIKFEDLFTKDTDIYSIVRQAFYKALAQNEINANFFWGNMYYDKEKNEWVQETYEYDEELEELIPVQQAYVPTLTEYDVSKKIQAFINSDKKDFYFSPLTVYIADNYGNYSQYNVDWMDIKDNVVIYNKYLTKDSLYESSDIGFKDLWICTAPENLAYLKYGFAEENLYFDLSIHEEYSETFEKNIKALQAKLYNDSLNNLEEYKKIARENPNQFYFLSFRPSITHNYNYTYNGTYTSKEYNIARVGMNECLMSVDISLKDIMMQQIMECYRENYNGELYYYYYEPLNDTNVKEERKNENYICDIRSFEELNTIDAIFKPNIEYMPIVKEKLRNKLEEQSKNYGGKQLTVEEINELINNATFSLSSGEIDVKIPGYEYGVWVSFGELPNSILNVYDTELYILSESNLRIVEKSEIESFSLEKLNRAYNEIFARHGHDFKNSELKSYFEKLNWYNVIPNKTVTLEELNEYEKENLNIIKQVIDEKKTQG